MRVYVSGPISLGGRLTPDECAENIAHFHTAAKALRGLGNEVLSPVEDVPDDLTWPEYMRIDLAMVLQADAVVVLPNWELSRGARLECHVARELGLPILPLADALEGSA